METAEGHKDSSWSSLTGGGTSSLGSQCGDVVGVGPESAPSGRLVLMCRMAAFLRGVTVASGVDSDHDSPCWSYQTEVRSTENKLRPGHVSQGANCDGMNAILPWKVLTHQEQIYQANNSPDVKIYFSLWNRSHWQPLFADDVTLNIKKMLLVSRQLRSRLKEHFLPGSFLVLESFHWTDCCPSVSTDSPWRSFQVSHWFLLGLFLLMTCFIDVFYWCVLYIIFNR